MDIAAMTKQAIVTGIFRLTSAVNPSIRMPWPGCL
jgi:hypothetical protein